MVVDDPARAERLVAAGVDVVLIVGEPAPSPLLTGPGRLARLVGDPDDPATVAAAGEMDRELFGVPPTFPPGPAPA